MIRRYLLRASRTFLLILLVGSTPAGAQTPTQSPFARGGPLEAWNDHRTNASSSQSADSRPFRFGLGLGAGPGLFQGAAGLWYEAFGAFNVRHGRRLELQLEPGFLKTASSYPLGNPRAIRYGAPSDGVVRLGNRAVGNAQEFDGTLFLLRSLIGYRFGSVFTLRGGVYAGYSIAKTQTTICGESVSRGVAYGGTVIPTVLLGRSGLELGLEVNVLYAQVQECVSREDRLMFVNGGNTHSALVFRAAYVGF